MQDLAQCAKACLDVWWNKSSSSELTELESRQYVYRNFMNNKIIKSITFVYTNWYFNKQLSCWYNYLNLL